MCDIILLIQIYFYRWLSHRKSQSSPAPAEGSNEESPLLVETLNERTIQNTRRPNRALLEFTGALLFVFATGLITWWVNSRPHQSNDTPIDPSGPNISESTIQVLGWASAILYCESNVHAVTSGSFPLMVSSGCPSSANL